jgi:hypothetical protein
MQGAGAGAGQPAQGAQKQPGQRAAVDTRPPDQAQQTAAVRVPRLQLAAAQVVPAASMAAPCGRGDAAEQPASAPPGSGEHLLATGSRVDRALAAFRDTCRGACPDAPAPAAGPLPHLIGGSDVWGSSDGSSSRCTSSSSRSSRSSHGSGVPAPRPLLQPHAQRVEQLQQRVTAAGAPPQRQRQRQQQLVLPSLGPLVVRSLSRNSSSCGPAAGARAVSQPGCKLPAPGWGVPQAAAAGSDRQLLQRNSMWAAGQQAASHSR